MHCQISKFFVKYVKDCEYPAKKADKKGGRKNPAPNSIFQWLCH